MAKKRVKIYKSPSGKGEYRSKLKNFLYIAEQGMAVPGARQQPVSRRMDTKQILTKEILRDYIVESLDDNYSDDQIRLAVMELTRAGHNPELVDIALKEAIAIKDQNIAATDDDFKKIVNEVDSEELRRKKLEEESRLQEEADDAADEEIIAQSFEDDDSYELDDESRDKIKQQLFFSDDEEETEETEEVNSKQLGGLVKMSLGGPPKSLLKLIGIITDAGRTIKSADEIIDDYAQIVAAEMKNLKNVEYDDLLKQDSFMNKVTKRIESDAQSALKEINKDKKFFQKSVNVGQETFGKLDSPLFKPSYLQEAQKIITDKTGKAVADWVGAGTKSGTRSTTGLKGIEFESVDEAGEILQSARLSDDAPGIARNIDSEIKVINIEDGNQQKAYVDALQSDAEKYFKKGKSGVTTSKNMQFVAYTADGKPIVRVQRSDGNVINGIFSGGDGDYTFKPILGLSGEGTPIYSKVDDVGVTGNELAETFMKSKNNQITNTDKLDQAFRLGTEGQVSKMGPLPEASVFKMDNATVISNPKTKYTNYSTDYVKGTPKSTIRNIGNIFTGQFNPRLLRSDSQFANRFSIPGYLQRRQAVVNATGQPILDPRMGTNYFNPLRGGFGLFGDASKTGADQGFLARKLGYNQNVTGFSDPVLDSRSIQGFTGYTPAQTNVIGQVQNPTNWFDNSAVQWAGRNLPFVSGRGTLINLPAGLATYNMLSGSSDPYDPNTGFTKVLKEGETETDLGKGDGYQFQDTTSLMNVNVGGKELSVPKDIFRSDPDIVDYKFKIQSETGITPTNDQIPKELIENATINYQKEQEQIKDQYMLGGMTKAQFVREGLKEFKKQFSTGGFTTESPGDVNQEVDVREKQKNTLIGAVQNNVAVDQRTKELEQQYDMLTNQEPNTMGMYDEGIGYGQLGFQTNRNMRKLNRQMRKAGRQLRRQFRRGMPSNLTNFETSGNIFNRKFSAEFDPSIPNMNPFSYGAGFGNMGMLLGNVIGQTINQVPTTFRVPLAQANNQVAVSNTNVDKEKAAQNQLEDQQKMMYLDILQKNPPAADETLEQYKSRVNLGDGMQITEDIFNMVKGANNPDFVIGGCFGGNCPKPKGLQEGGFVDSSNPDLYKFVYGGDEMMYKAGGATFPDLSGDGKVTQKDILMGRGVIPEAREGIQVGEEVLRSLPMIPAPTSIEQQTMLEYRPEYGAPAIPVNPYSQASNIAIDPNMATPAIVEEASPTVIFNEQTGQFEEVAPAEAPLVTVAPGEGAAPALLDTSKEAIDLAVSKAPAGMEIPDDVKAEGANAVSTYIMNQMKRGVQTKAFNLNVNPEIQGGLRGVQGEISYEGAVGQKYNPGIIKAGVTGGWNNPGYRGDGTDPSTAFQTGSKMWNVDASVGYTTPKSKSGSTWTGTAGVTYDRDESGKGEFKPTIGLSFNPGSNQMGGEPELPQNFLGGLGRLMARGYAANPAFGRRLRYSGPQTMAGQMYYGAPGNLVSQTGKRGLFNTRWTNTYAVPGTQGTPGSQSMSSLAGDNAISNFNMGFMQNRPDFNAPEEVDNRSRFERRADRRADRLSSKYDRRDARKYERNRRRSIRQGMGDPGSYADDQARAEADNLAYEAQREKELEDFVAQGVTPLELRKKEAESNIPGDIVGRDRALPEPMFTNPADEVQRNVTFTGTTIPQGARRSDYTEGVIPTIYNMDNFQNRVYTSDADRLMGDDNITFSPTGTNRPTLQNKNPQTPKSEEQLMAELNNKMNVASKFTRSPGYFSSSNRPDPNASTGVGADPNYASMIEGTFQPNLPNVPMTGPAVTSPDPAQEIRNRMMIGNYGKGMRTVPGSSTPVTVAPTDEELIQADVDAAINTKQYGGWYYAQGGPMIDDEVEMTDEELEMFMRAGGVVEFI